MRVKLAGVLIDKVKVKKEGSKYAWIIKIANNEGEVYRVYIGKGRKEAEEIEEVKLGQQFEVFVEIPKIVYLK